MQKKKTTNLILINRSQTHLDLTTAYNSNTGNGHTVIQRRFQKLLTRFCFDFVLPTMLEVVSLEGRLRAVWTPFTSYIEHLYVHH